MNNEQLLLGVNIDHIATIRQARRTTYPDPVEAALLAEKAGVDGITAHLREDRRHIQEYDIIKLQEAIGTRLNLEMAVTKEMIDFALKVKPRHCCLVPEKREELTTEGGLNVIGNYDSIKNACSKLQDNEIEVSLFIDPDIKQIDTAIATQASTIEIHTGAYAEAKNKEEVFSELERIKIAAQYAHQAGLIVNAGHGLHYENVKAIADVNIFNELNIGHSIIAKAMMIGMKEAVQQMLALMR